MPKMETRVTAMPSIQKLKDLQTGEVVSDDIGDWIVTTSKERAAN